MNAAKLYTDDSLPGLAGPVRFEWDALDTRYEEDERIFVHPRSPYARVDALRATRHMRVVRNGQVDVHVDGEARPVTPFTPAAR